MAIVLISLLLCGIGIAGVMLGVLSRFRRMPGARAFIISILAAAVWSAGYLIEILTPIYAIKIAAAKFQYLGIVSLPAAWFVFSLTYFEPPAWFETSRRRLALLSIVPLITLALAWTNERHGLIWRQAPALPVGDFSVIVPQYGPWFWVNWVYSYLLLLIGSIWLGSRVFSANRLHRRQIGFALAGILAPWAGNLIYISDFNPLQHLDWTPTLFIVSGLLLAISLFRFHLIQVAPIAYQTIVNNSPDGILVLDLNDKVMDINPAGLRILGRPERQVLGMPISRVLPNVDIGARVVSGPSPAPPAHPDAALSSAPSADPAPALSSGPPADPAPGLALQELSFDSPTGRRTYDLRLSLLTDRLGAPVGRLVVLHDFTRRAAERASLQQHRDELERAVLERSSELLQTNEQLRRMAARLADTQEIERRRMAQHLHDRVGQSLTGLNLNLRLVQGRLPADTEGDVQKRLDEALNLVETTTRQVREVMSELDPPLLVDYGLQPALASLCGKFQELTGIETVALGEPTQARLPLPMEIVFYRIAQEALNNIAKHAHASQVTLNLEVTPENAFLSVEDNGVGFQPDAVNETGGEPHWGLRILNERAAALGGELQIQSKLGAGTHVCINVRRTPDED